MGATTTWWVWKINCRLLWKINCQFLWKSTCRLHTYIEYTYEREYLPEKKYTKAKRTSIGKMSKENLTMMQPNHNFVKFFPEVELPDLKNITARSSCLRVGSFIVIKKIIEAYGLPDILGQYFDYGEVGLFLDLAVYSIVCENNAGQYYPDYAYNHPLFTNDIHIYSDSKVSRFLNSIKDDQIVGFLNSWNEARDHREKIYISYDSTNKNCQAGDIEMVEYGHAKDDKGLPVFNYSIAYDTNNKVPLFYEEYPGSIVDISQLQYMLEKAKGYGYRKVDFILDRGYFSKENIQYMDKCGYDFVIMVKGMASLVNQLVLENKGSFESKRVCYIKGYGAYGKTIRRKLYVTDKKDRYFHIYHKIQKESSERQVIEAKIERMANYLEKQKGSIIEICDAYKNYFEIFTNEKTGVFVMAREKAEVVERELELSGYFVIITSKKMSAKEALTLYKSRDESEKLFRGDKTYLGNKSLRVHSDESASAKIMIEFVALIVRNRIYTLLKEEKGRLEKKPNYMTVPAALKELEKIEMIRYGDNVYRLDHAVTATQKVILKAFGINKIYMKDRVNRISEQLVNASMKGESADGENAEVDND